MRILLAIDGSPGSLVARDLVAGLPMPHESTVRLFCAYPGPTWLVAPAAFTRAAAPAESLLADAEAAARRHALSVVADGGATLEAAGKSVERQATHRRPADGIIEAADRMDADLIVLGSRGHGSIESMLLGSVSAEVAERARQSVLVARSASISRLLVATDGAPRSEVIPRVIGAWNVFAGYPAHAISVAPVNSPLFDLLVGLYMLNSAEVEPTRDQLMELHRGFARSLAAQLSEAGIPSDAEVRSGDAAAQIVQAAHDVGADLVITGSSNLHGLDRLLLGSVARNVLLHARTSTLVVRERDNRDPSAMTHADPRAGHDQ